MPYCNAYHRLKNNGNTLATTPIIPTACSKLNMFKKTLSNGYTLIELLLVTSLLATTATFSVLSYQQHHQKQRAEKTALEMQAFAAAALNFEADNNRWPTANASIDSCTTIDANTKDHFIKNYVANQSAKSTLGSDYCWSAVNPEQLLFWVALKIPPHGMALSKQITALLPNALGEAWCHMC